MVKYENKFSNYINTLIFTVIAKGISVILLGILIFDPVKPYIVGILTLEIGLLFIIFWSLYSIHQLNISIAKKKNEMMNSKIVNVPCPDYFVRDIDNDNNLICKNDYTTPDGKITYSFKVLNDGTDEETQYNNSIDTIPVESLLENKKFQDVCDTYFNENSIYEHIPWTGVKPKCNAHSFGSLQ